MLQQVGLSGIVDYYPFGMVTPGRSFSAGDGYRFGFNGKESDSETYGSGNIYDYGFRIYNPRLGKFLSVDPLANSYPWYTPYQFASNNPIRFIDIDGLEAGEPAFVAYNDLGSWVSWDGNVWYFTYYNSMAEQGADYTYFKEDDLMLEGYVIDLEPVVIKPAEPLFIGDNPTSGISKLDAELIEIVVSGSIDIIISALAFTDSYVTEMIGVSYDAYSANEMDLLPGIELEHVLNDDDIIAFTFVKTALTENEELAPFNEAVMEANEKLSIADDYLIEVILLTDEQYTQIRNGEKVVFDNQDQFIDPGLLEFELYDHPEYTHIIYYRRGDDGSSAPSGNLREYEVNE